MANLPIDLICANGATQALVSRAAEIANAVQDQFVFTLCTDPTFADWFPLYGHGQVDTVQFFDELAGKRQASRGYHPFVMAFTEAFLVGNKLSNLFANQRSEAGLSVVTTFGLAPIVGEDPDATTGYILYYMARHSMSFVSPGDRNHDETRQCLYDRKIAKVDIIQSMRSGAICGQCRTAIWNSGKGTGEQMDAVDRLLDHASSLVHRTTVRRRANIFIGSSSKHLPQARLLKRYLGPDFDIHVWDEDAVFRLGSATIEMLEEHVSYYDFGVFLMFPDDRIERNNGSFMCPRDNVVFEAGLFSGKLSRNRAVILTTLSHQVTLPSDLHGLTTLQIDYEAPPEDALVLPARRAADHIKRVFEKGAT